ncbi:hypothetical protein C0Q70_04801 [Pomacea canaliculata]|uniref:Uncharacterized protein n=1 Tax=Pomacea canaliculata TaxID=400727 RepID=A0A2T7PJH3_POMCA|nr:hypothetical protein C0Q70_04801 [Pomacea canaliculata]
MVPPVSSLGMQFYFPLLSEMKSSNSSSQKNLRTGQRSESTRGHATVSAHVQCEVSYFFLLSHLSLLAPGCKGSIVPLVF